MRAPTKGRSNPPPRAADPSNQLAEAVKRLDLAETRRLLEDPSANPNLPDGNGRTAMFNVISAQPGPHDESPLAFEERRASVLRELLCSSKVHTGHRDNDGQTILLIMVKQRLGTLLEKSVHLVGKELLDTKDHKGRTPLSWAAGNADLHATCGLLTLGASVNLEDDEKRSPLLWALNNIIFNKVDEPHDAPRNPQPSSPPKNLHDSVDRALPVIKTLLEHKAFVYKEDILMTLVETSHVGLVEAVFAYVSLNRVVHYKLPSIIVHSFLQNSRFAHVYPSIISDRDFGRWTLLHVAAWVGFEDLVLELLSQGAEIDATNVDGATPLRLAVSAGRVDNVKILLQKGAELTGISRDDWAQCLRHCDMERGFLVLTEEGRVERPLEKASQPDSDSGGERKRMKRSFQLVSDLRDVKNSSADGRRLFLRENGKAVPDHFRVHEVDQDTISMERGLSDTEVYFGVRVPVDYSRRMGATWKWHEVAWSGREGNTGGERPGTRGDYYSTLHYGYIPDSLPELCRQFLLTITKEWRAACDRVFTHLSNRRQDQIEAMGNNKEFIRFLAHDAELLETFRSYHRGHAQTATRFSTDIMKHFPSCGNLVDGPLDDLSNGVQGELDRLDQTVRDMLQLELAWVSVNEAYRSTSLGTSMKRLSWITFIFLPAIFVSSLFGMNVDILENNPSWLWYLLFAGAVFTFTMFGWLLFKFVKVEDSMEKYVGDPMQRFVDEKKGKLSVKIAKVKRSDSGML